MTGDRAVRALTAAAVLLVAVIAAVVSFLHIEHLADRDHRRRARVGSLQKRSDAARTRARHAQCAPRGPHALLRARRRQHEHPVAA